jgi:hypothetical protein
MIISLVVSLPTLVQIAWSHDFGSAVGIPVMNGYQPLSDPVPCMWCTNPYQEPPVIASRLDPACPVFWPNDKLVFGITRTRYECVHPHEPEFVYSYLCSYTQQNCTNTLYPWPDCEGPCAVQIK